MVHDLDVEYLKTETGFKMFAKYSKIFLHGLIAPFLIALLVLFIFVFNESIKFELSDILFWLIYIMFMFVLVLYFTIARQSIILDYPKLKIGVSIGALTFPSKSIDFTKIRRIYYKEIESSGLCNVVLELNNVNDQQPELILFGKHQTIERCKKIAWHLNNYLNGVA